MNKPVFFYVISDVTDKHSIPDLRGRKPFKIPSFQEIIDPRPDKSGTVFIRFAPGEKSIFVDEQKTPFDLHKIVKGEHKYDYIKFDSGRRGVEPRETMLLEYLKHAKQNVLNAEKNGYSGTLIKQFDPQADRTKRTEAFAQDNNLRSQILELDIDVAKAVYRAMGEGVSVLSLESMASADIRHDLYIAAKKDEGTFKRLLADQLLMVRYDIYEGLDKGVLWRNNSDLNTFMFAGGSIIKQAPQGVNPVEWFAHWLVETGAEVHLIIRTKLGRAPKKGTTANNQTDPAILDEVIDWCAQNSSDERVLEKNGAHRVFRADDGAEYKLGTGWETIKRNIQKDTELITKIAERYLSVKA